MTISLLLVPLSVGAQDLDAGLDAADACSCSCDVGLDADADAGCSCDADVDAGEEAAEANVPFVGPPAPEDWPTKSIEQKALVKDLYTQTKDINKDLDSILKKLEKKAKKRKKKKREAREAREEASPD